jgi:hypothetical protein
MQARWHCGTMYGEATLRGNDVLGDMLELEISAKVLDVVSVCIGRM